MNAFWKAEAKTTLFNIAITELGKSGIRMYR